MIIHGDSFEEVKTLETNSIDALVTDPPYGMSNISHKAFMDCMVNWCTDDDMYLPKAKGFMNKSWDGFVPPPGFWKEVLRVLKPGAYGLVFASSRTMDLMGLALRIAGFEIRDCITWLYGSGFPKSHDISQAIDKIKGCKRKIVGKKTAGMGSGKTFGMLQAEGDNKSAKKIIPITAPSSQEAKQWSGWGTALKPSYEPALLIRKPLNQSVAENVLEWGVGGLNIDGCRIDSNESLARMNKLDNGMFGCGKNANKNQQRIDQGLKELGRFPSNTLFDNEAIKELKEQSRFFYTAKSSSAERSAGLKKNIHPTVKPIEIMRYLCRLITPPNGLILEPFLGSGTTAIAAHKENFRIIGIEREQEYVEIAKARLEYWKTHEHAMTPQNPPVESEQMNLFERMD
jgi:site-specific DNA-methyltransferase (adenine-specific)